MTEFTDLCHTHRRDDNVETARAVLNALRRSGWDRAIEVLLPAVANQARLVFRTEVRAIEEVSRIATISTDSPWVNYQDFVRQTFRLGDGRAVTWGEATVEEHELYIAMCSKIRNGINATISRHKRLVDTLRAEGVKCLNDLIDRAA